MRANGKIQLYVAKDLNDALTKVSDPGCNWQPLAGGTDIMVHAGSSLQMGAKFIAIGHLPELRSIELQNETLSIGSCATYTDIRSDNLVKKYFPMLDQAAAATGALAIQNQGTIGGNIANASPAADTPPALLAYGAEIQLISTRGTRTMPYCDFHTGYKTTAKKPDEIIRRVILRKTNESNFLTFYRKVGTRSSLAISKVVFAASAGMTANGFISHIRLAYGSMGPTPLRALRTESLLKGTEASNIPADEAIRTLAKDLCPIDDIRSTKTYRQAVAGNLLKQFIEQLRGITV